MRRNFQVVLLLLVLFGLSNCKKANTDILYSKEYINEIKEARKITGFKIASSFIPGGTIAVVKDREIIYSEGFGWASKDLEIRATRDNKFRIGTLSQLITNIIYQKMVEEGILNPDSTIQHYYPDFPEKEYKITLDHLVQETSGIREPNYKENNLRGLNISIEKGLDSFKDDPLLSPPQMFQNASTFNYNLLGVIMEKASGEKFRTLLESYITDTLHLENTCIDNPFLPVKGRSDFFDNNMVAQVVNATFYDLRFRAPSEGMLSNAEDLAKFGNALLNSDYISESIREKLFEPVTLLNDFKSQMANGWMLLSDRKGRAIYGKEGSVTGGSSAILMYPEENLVVAYTTNLSSANSDSPVFEVAKLFLPKDEEQAEQAKQQE